MECLECPVCGENKEENLWSDAVSWGCKCGYYEDAYKGPSFPINEFGIRQVQESNIPANSTSSATS